MIDLVNLNSVGMTKRKDKSVEAIVLGIVSTLTLLCTSICPSSMGAVDLFVSLVIDFISMENCLMPVKLVERDC